MDNTELKQKLESSFPPYCCVIQFDPDSYGTMLGFQVYDNNGKVLTSSRGIRTAMINSEDALSEYITKIKIEIRKNGFPIS